MKPPPDSFAAAVDDFREAWIDVIRCTYDPFAAAVRRQPRWRVRLTIVVLTVFHLALAAMGHR